MRNEAEVRARKEKWAQCEKCINSYSSMNDEPYLCGIRPCPLIQELIRENVKKLGEDRGEVYRIVGEKTEV